MALLILLILALGGSSVQGVEIVKSRIPSFWLHGGGGYGYTNTAADTVAGATYAQHFGNPFIADAGIGYLFPNRVFLGLRYEYWIASRRMSVSGSADTIDNLRFQVASLDAGYTWGNTRVLWMLIASAGYPLRVQVESASGTFSPPALRGVFQAKLRIAIRFVSFSSLLLEGGYRLANCGPIAQGSTPYLEGNADFNLSGPFLGLGVAFHF